MDSSMRRLLRIAAIACLALMVSGGCHAAPISLPELLYYKFDEGSGTTTANWANPGAGSDPATLVGLTFGATGSSGGSLAGAGGSSSSHYLNTGWDTSLGTGSWTIAFWMSSLGAAETTYYYFGDVTNSFRCFTGGVAETGNLILRGTGITDVPLVGLSSTANNHVAFVYDSVADVIRAYLNGELKSTISQGSVNLSGSLFKVGGYSSSNALRSGEWMDEFQVYSRALSTADVTSAMNADFISGVPEPSSLALVGAGCAVVVLRLRRRARRTAGM